MLAGIEFVVSVAAMGLGIALFVLAMRRRPVVVLPKGVEESTGAILNANLLSLSIIALLFFGLGFLIDTFQ